MAVNFNRRANNFVGQFVGFGKKRMHGQVLHEGMGVERDDFTERLQKITKGTKNCRKSTRRAKGDS